MGLCFILMLDQLMKSKFMMPLAFRLIFKLFLEYMRSESGLELGYFIKVNIYV